MQVQICDPGESTARGDRERGASLVEYALLVALIAVVCIAGITAFGSATSTSFSNSGNSIIAN